MLKAFRYFLLIYDVEKYVKLKEFNLMRFNFRQFYHFITFTFSLLFINNKKLILKERIMRNANNKTHTIQTRRSYAIPLYISNTIKYSFTSIAPKTINSLKKYKNEN